MSIYTSRNRTSPKARRNTDKAPTPPQRAVRNVSGTDDRNGTETGATVQSDTTSRDHAPSPKQTRAPSHPLQDLTDDLHGRSRYPITSGGFGDIWKCDLVKPDMTVQVAVKTIRAFESDDEVLMRKNSRRVRRELKVWGRLKHDTILPLWGVATDFGPYPAMICPWAENGALTGYLEREESSLSSHDKFSLLNDIALGLQYLHSKSVVHGDLTGSNVLIYSNGRACLADFGLSTIILEFVGTSYFTSSIRGNVRWVAAELCEVSEDDELSLSTECDIYSFGSITLQVLTCKVPYHNVKKDIAVLGQVIKGIKPEPPEESQIAPGHWEFMQRCWLPRASRPSVAEIVTFVACERQSVSS
ncbi:kinase-like domain-containing protein [Suillus variegatus]|nr:kinase-like domain-containing protein [Suillus variegatus]